MQNVILLYVTCPDAATARQIGRALVQERLIACANMLAKTCAIYRWEGALTEADEVVLLLKTTHEREPEVVARIQALHPYSNPAILTLPVRSGAPEFLAWVARETEAEISD